MKKISQGTVSTLIGCHSIIHTILVIRAWKRVHGRSPEPWEIGCIALHDVGHIGLQYLDDVKEKERHWILGAELARIVFGEKGYRLCAGHSTSSGVPRSDLYLPDKFSWLLAPKWWLYWQCMVEPKLYSKTKGMVNHVEDFQDWVRNNIESDEVRETHEAFIELKDG